MANYNLSDILRRELWTVDDINESPYLQNLYNSGILVTDGRIQRAVDNNDIGTKVEIPFIKEGDYLEPNISDDSTDKATPNKWDKFTQMALLGNYNNSWGAYDIARQLDSGSDPYLAIRDYIGKYWAYDIQHRMASFSTGIFEDNKANDNNDLHNDQTDKTFDYEFVIDTNQLKGDYGVAGSDFMLMHSALYSAIKKTDPERIRAILDSKGNILYHLYDERSIVIIDDIMPFDGTNGTVMFANSGAFSFADSKDVKNPLMYERDELIGMGGGQEIIISRKRYLLAVNGFTYTGAVQDKSTGASLAELRDKDNHDRIVHVKQSPISFLTFAV
jgi:hypothetical protein